MPVTLEEAISATEKVIRHYNEERLHSSLGHITPKDKLEGREKEIFAARDRKLEEARARQAKARARSRSERNQPNKENGNVGSEWKTETTTDPSRAAAQGAAVAGTNDNAYAAAGVSISS